MKICTINVPESYIDAINKLIGENGLYPSRSELIRVAVREFLLRELKIADQMNKYDQLKPEDFDDENYVRVPIEAQNENEEPIREYKTYRIVKKLSYNTTKDNNQETNNDNYEFSFEGFNESLDDCPLPNNYIPPSLDQLRHQFPKEPFFKFINE